MYRLALLPIAWWGSEMASYEPWAVKTIHLAAAAAPALRCAALAVSFHRGQALQLLEAATLLSLVASAAGAWLFRGSLLRRMAPPRSPSN